MPRNSGEGNLARKNAALKLVAKVADKDDAMLDNVIHERSRLAIVSALAVNDSLSFGDLKNLLAMSDGNLSVHTQKLEAAGYVSSSKKFRGRVPLTEYKLTAKGRTALERYLGHMEAIIKSVSGRK